MVFEQVCADLEGEGYEVQPIVLPACGVNAPHRRDRVWIVAYRNNTRAGNGMRNDGKWTENNNRWNGQPQFEFREDGKNGPDQNPNEDGRGGDEQVIPDTESTGSTRRTERTESEHSVNGGTGENGDAANAGNEGLQRWKLDGTPNQKGQIGREQPPRSTTKRHKITDWTDWPTVAPLCSRNDGLSSRLDGITFPKWRNESIKAGGNAIVPQVALQIFKAIEQYQSLNQ